MENAFENPEMKEYKKDLWRFGLYSIKTEIVLYDLRQSLYWQSIMEVGIMLSAFIALLTAHSLLFFMHIVHLIRPYVGFRIIFRLPKTHVLLEQLSDSPVRMQEEATELIVNQFKSASTFYSHYLILSGIAAVFDLLALLYNLSNTGSNINSYVFYLNISWIFLAFDLYMLLWSKSLMFTFPKSLWDTSREIANNTIKDTSNIINGMMENFVKGVK
jgi:hypothetical protein